MVAVWEPGVAAGRFDFELEDQMDEDFAAPDVQPGEAVDTYAARVKKAVADSKKKGKLGIVGVIGKSRTPLVR